MNSLEIFLLVFSVGLLFLLWFAATMLTKHLIEQVEQASRHAEKWQKYIQIIDKHVADLEAMKKGRDKP